MSHTEEHLHAMRHSLAHITASAVKKLWPEAKFGVGPVVENGFYYDIDLGEQKISESDFKKIEKEMRAVINQAQEFERFEMPVDQAIEWARENGQPYKEELLNDLKRSGTTIAKDLDADELGLITEAYDELDWDDEVRIFLEERASFSPDAMTGMEANLRFAGPETMETRIFGRLTAWQNWIFQRPNAVGESGALQRYGTGVRGEYDMKRV